VETSNYTTGTKLHARTYRIVMRIEPINKSSVSVRFGQGQGSGSVRFDWSFISLMS